MAWGWLKWAAPIGAAIAAPFTGGASLASLPGILGTAAKVGAAVAPALGGAAKERGAATAAAEQAQLERDRLALLRAQLAQQQAQQAAEFGAQRAQFLAQAPTIELRTALRAAMLSGLQPVRGVWSTEGGRPRLTFTGGLDLAALPQELRDFAQQVMRETMTQRLRDQYPASLPAAALPEIAPAPTGGGASRALGLAAGISGLLGSTSPLIEELLRRRRASQTPAEAFEGDPRVWANVRF
jgi:hypothetical protein